MLLTSPHLPTWLAPFINVIDNCDLARFGIKQFDLPFLRAEFARVGVELPLERRAIVDVMELFHNMEKRDLAAALLQFCGREHVAAHAALADATATAEVLDAMLAYYPDLPQTSEDLDRHFRDPDAVDRDGRFARKGEQIVFTFGKYRFQPLATVARSDQAYLRWMLRAGFSGDTTRIVREALREAASDTSCQDQPQPIDSGPAFLPITPSPTC